MIAQLYSFAVGALAFIFYTIVFLILMRLRLRIGWVTLQASSGIIIYILFSILSLYFINGFLFWYALGVFLVGWFCFFTLSTAIYVSISARILRTINKQPDLSFSLDGIFRLCIRKPFQKRADFLVFSGLAQKGEFGFRITDTGYKNARRLQAMRRLFGMEGSGLYSSTGGIKMETRAKK
jgi:hypothetical protein